MCERVEAKIECVRTSTKRRGGTDKVALCGYSRVQKGMVGIVVVHTSHSI